MNDLKTPFTKQYFKIRKLSDTELNERRSLTAMAIALQMEKNLAPWQQSLILKRILNINYHMMLFNNDLF